MILQEEIEDYLESLEDFLASSIPDLPNVRGAVQRLWLDISRFGPQSLPSLPDIHVPGLGTFEVPPPPPPPPPKSWFEESLDLVRLYPWTFGGIVVGVAGASLLVGYGAMHKRARFRRVKTVANTTTERRQIIGAYSLSLWLYMQSFSKTFQLFLGEITIWLYR